MCIVHNITQMQAFLTDILKKQTNKYVSNLILHKFVQRFISSCENTTWKYYIIVFFSCSITLWRILIMSEKKCAYFMARNDG